MYVLRVLLKAPKRVKNVLMKRKLSHATTITDVSCNICGCIGRVAFTNKTTEMIMTSINQSNLKVNEHVTKTFYFAHYVPVILVRLDNHNFHVGLHKSGKSYQVSAYSKSQDVEYENVSFE